MKINQAKANEIDNAGIYIQIDELEKTLLRPLREYALDSTNQAAVDKIATIEVEISNLRSSLK